MFVGLRILPNLYAYPSMSLYPCVSSSCPCVPVPPYRVVSSVNRYELRCAAVLCRGVVCLCLVSGLAGMGWARCVVVCCCAVMGGLVPRLVWGMMYDVCGGVGWLI
jgi:hypothetical protein